MVFKFWFPLNTYKWSQDNEPKLSCFEISAKSEAHHFAPHSLTRGGVECCSPQCRHQPRTNNRALSSTMSGPPIRSIPDLTYYTADFYMVLMDQEDVKM